MLEQNQTIQSAVSAFIWSLGLRARCWIVLFATIIGYFGAIPVTAEASGYTLVTGKQYSLCREFLQTLRSFSDRTVAFEWPVERHSKNFRRPKWEPINALDHLDVVEKIYRSRRDGTLGPNPLTDEDTSRGWQQLRAKVVEEITSGVARLERSRLDFNNDGRQEQAFRYGQKVYPVSETLLTLEGDHRLLGWWYWFDGDDGVSEKQWTMYGDMALYDIFFYRGRAYFGRYGYDLLRIGKITEYIIYEPQIARGGLSLSMTSVCLFSHSDQ